MPACIVNFVLQTSQRKSCGFESSQRILSVKAGLLVSKPRSPHRDHYRQHVARMIVAMQVGADAICHARRSLAEVDPAGHPPGQCGRSAPLPTLCSRILPSPGPSRGDGSDKARVAQRKGRRSVRECYVPTGHTNSGCRTPHATACLAAGYSNRSSGTSRYGWTCNVTVPSA